MDNREFLQSLVSLCPDGIIGVDRQGTIVIFNEAAENLTGWRAGDVIGKAHIDKIYDPPSLSRQIKKMLHSPDHGGNGRLVGARVDINTREGHLVPIRLSAALIMEDGVEVGSVGFFHDLTQQKQLEDELRRLSVTDSLTGLFNRRHFHTLLSDEVLRSQRYGRPLTLITFDLDHFKPFNDTFGHQEGDNILRQVTACARAVLREQDRAFRLGGDEFALVMVETNLESAALAAERFRRHFNDSWPLAMSEEARHLKPVSISLGVAQLTPGEKSDSLIKRADLAMYEAKRAGGDRTIQAQQAIGARAEP